MEINSDSPAITDKSLMRNFYNYFKRRTYIIITAVQCLFLISTFAVLELLQAIHVGWILLFIIIFVSAAVLNAITITLVHVLGKPFRDLVQAVILTAGEHNTSTPPNPNTDEYTRNGFKDILQTVYELAAARDDKKESQPSSESNNFVVEGLNQSTSGVVILDNDRKIIFNNPLAPVHERPDGSLELQLIFPPDDTFEDWLDKCQKNKLSADHGWTRIANLLPGEKDRRIFDVVANYHKNSAAETVITLFDRTEVYSPEEDDLDFISFAAHELRGPITVIRGYLDVLRDELKPSLEQEQSELMDRLVVTANRLSSYVNNILNASRYDRRHFKLHLNEVNIRRIYDDVADDMQMRANAQNRMLIADIPDNLPLVAADANAISEVFGNLIDNAIKYSNEGGLVHVVAHAIPGFVEVSVIDRGIGMPTNVLPNLFHKFYRSHRSRETVAGTGIGLYICKAIVSSHGGSITARSVENEGSTFTFTLPIYDTVVDKLKATNNSNTLLIEHGSGWIKNHTMFRG